MFTCVPHPEPSSLLPPHTLSLGRPSAPAPSIQYRASNLDWRLVSYMIFSLSCIGEGNGNPLQCSCLENPRDGRPWWAAIYGVAQSQTRPKWQQQQQQQQFKRKNLMWIIRGFLYFFYGTFLKRLFSAFPYSHMCLNGFLLSHIYNLA